MHSARARHTSGGAGASSGGGSGSSGFEYGSASSAAMWEELRKEARKLEGELDVKLAAYSKLGGGEGGSGEGSSDALATSKGAEIETLLQRLSDVNDAMSSAVSGGGDARAHTLARHRDILTEFTQEFRRVRNNVSAGREREALLGGRGVDSGGGSFTGVQIGNGATGQLLRERASITSAGAQLEDVISSAQATVGALGAQRALFTDISGKIAATSAKFPAVNNLLAAIRRKKSKDTIILSAVIAGCTLFLLIYWLSK